MHKLKLIRERLGVTQKALGNALGYSQGNIANYESGQTLLPETARKLIEFAASRGMVIGFDHVYGEADLPVRADEAASA